MFFKCLSLWSCLVLRESGSKKLLDYVFLFRSMNSSQVWQLLVFSSNDGHIFTKRNNFGIKKVHLDIIRVRASCCIFYISFILKKLISVVVIIRLWFFVDRLTAKLFSSFLIGRKIDYGDFGLFTLVFLRSSWLVWVSHIAAPLA